MPPKLSRNGETNSRQLLDSGNARANPIDQASCVSRMNYVRRNVP